MKAIGYTALIIFCIAGIFKIIDSDFGHKERWINWGRNQTCNPHKIFYPKSKEELRALIQEAKNNNYKIHAYGSSHAWSDIVCSEYLINTDSLNKVLVIDKERLRVTVEGGIKLEALNKALAQEGLALENLPDMTAMSIAGLTATATHGTGHTGTLADFIEEIELLTADGTLRTLSLQQNPEHFEAARTSVGALGVIYSLTLKCVPLFKVKYSRTAITWPELQKTYKDLYNKNDYFMFLWNPYTDKAVTYSFNKTDAEPTTAANAFLWFKQKLFLGYWTGAFWVQFFEWFPHLMPKFMDFLFDASQIKDYVDYGYKLLARSHGPRDEVIYEEEEIAIPIESLDKALEDVRRITDKYRKENFYVFMWGILFRFVKADTHSLLSTTSGRDTVYISITAPKVNEAFYREFEEAMLKYKGRPHWGKINFLDSKRAKDLYGKQFEQFIKVRKELDPTGMFSNAFTERVFK
jgi:L-gulono-1,4-lactone dehydrogenase